MIRTSRDLDKLRSFGALPPAYQAHVESLFAQLGEALGGGEPDFSLDGHCFIVRLEAGDDPHRLLDVDLDHLEEGLLGASPKYVEEVDLGGLLLYRSLVLYDNAYGHICPY